MSSIPKTITLSLNKESDVIGNLYQKLLSIDKGITLTDSEIRKVSSTINLLPKNKLEVILALIYYNHFSIKNHDPVVLAGKLLKSRSSSTRRTKILLPCQGKVCSGGKGVIFSLDNFDKTLTRVIVNYVITITK